jgi:hypothetical protein
MGMGKEGSGYPSDLSVSGGFIVLITYLMFECDHITAREINSTIELFTGDG